MFRNLATLHILLITMVVAECAGAGTRSPQPALTISPDGLATTQVDVAPPPTSIRSLDFTNFTFPAWPIYSKVEEPFTLKNGRYSGRLHDGAVFPEPFPVFLVDTIYGDVTGDSAEEAILVLTESIRGTAIPYYVYIYGMPRNKHKLLWSFETGDRADGGLRQIFAENGALVVELYGHKIYVGSDYYSGNDPACCPSHYTRSRYKWTRERFRLQGKLEVFPNQGSAPYVPLLERHKRQRERGFTLTT